MNGQIGTILFLAVVCTSVYLIMNASRNTEDERIAKMTPLQRKLDAHIRSALGAMNGTSRRIDIIESVQRDSLKRFNKRAIKNGHPIVSTVILGDLTPEQTDEMWAILARGEYRKSRMHFRNYSIYHDDYAANN